MNVLNHLRGALCVMLAWGTVVSAAAPPTIASFSPNSGPPGTRVTINGENFADATAVSFNNAPAAFTVDFTGTQISATVPDGATTGPVRVVTPAGTGASSTPFTVTAASPPTISSFGPASGPIGTQVTILGQNFDAVTAVEFGGAPANFVIGATGSNIFTSVPGNAVTGPITVKAPTGTNQSGSVFTVTVSPPPSITDFSPTLGPVGSSVTISGSNLSFITNVLFNGQPAAFNHGFFGTTVIATVPAGATTGPISVASSGGTSTSTTSFTVTVSPPPVITGFSPVRGRPGQSVTVNGENLNTATAVSYNGTPAVFDVFGPVLLTIVPAGATTGPISVTTSGGTAVSDASFEVIDPRFPLISGFSPAGGDPGTVVAITGDNFNNVAGVRFHDNRSASFNLISPQRIDAVVPAGTITGPISVTTDIGTETTSTNFFAAAQIASFTPASGPVGTAVTITGSNFSHLLEVAFGAIRAAFSNVSPTQIIATVPADAVTGPISLVTPATTTVSSSPFTVLPTITGFSPQAGLPGTVVRLEGSGFAGVTQVRLNGLAAAFSNSAPDELVVTVPANATTGPFTITTPAMSVSSSTSFFVGRATDTGVQVTQVPERLNPGDRLTYTITVTNRGPGTATNVVVTTTLPPTVDQIFIFSNSGNCSDTNRVVTCVFASLAAGASTTIKVNALVTSTNQPLRNVVQVRSAEFEADSSDNEVEFTVPTGDAPPPPPSIAGFSPASARPGELVNITGSNLQTASSVTFGGAAALFNVSGSALTAVVPSNAVTGPIRVTTAGGTAVSANNFIFIDPRQPVITGFTPQEGRPGTTVRITGGSFTNITEVRFANLVLAAFTILSNEQLDAISPTGAVTGPITLVTLFGNATTTSNFVALPPLTPPPAPVIASFAPSSGRPGESVTISGQNLSNATAVTFGGAAAAFSVTGAVIVATVPANGITGPITVTNPGGTATSATVFTVIDPRVPIISGFSPQQGSPGTPVSITGASFTNVTGVRFHDGVVAAFTVLSNEQLNALAPTGAVTGPITLVSPFGSATTTSNFVVLPPPPAISSFSPERGRPGESVTINGQNFSNATQVTFGGATASFSVTGAVIVATVPSNAVTGAIGVTTPSGTAASTNVFTVIDPRVPIISGFSPQEGPPGTRVSITGANFTNITGVRFHDGVVAAFAAESNEQLNAISPTGAVTGPITLVTPFGNATTSSNFVALPPPPAPVIASFTPQSGRPGESVTISGQNFSNATEVTFGGAAASFSVTGAVVVATIPSNAVTGPIGVTTPGGTATSTNVFTVIDPRVPIISGFSPQQGPPGTLVSITGANFTNVTEVRFHDGAVAAFTLVSNEQLDTRSPTGAVTGPITLVTPFGNVTTSSNFVAQPAPVDVALTIARVDRTHVSISWPAEPAEQQGLRLESTDSLGPAAVWVPSTNPPVVVEGQARVIETSDAGNRFYRLHRP